MPSNGTSKAGAVPEPDCSVGIDDWLICVARTDTGCRRVLEAPDWRMAGRSCESERRHVAVHSFVLPRSHFESLVPDPDIARVTNHFVELSPRLQVRQVGIAREVVEVLTVRGDRAYVRGTLSDAQRYVSDGVHRVAPGTAIEALGT